MSLAEQIISKNESRLLSDRSSLKSKPTKTLQERSLNISKIASSSSSNPRKSQRAVSPLNSDLNVVMA
jgi:hypothetical protein